MVVWVNSFFYNNDNIITIIFIIIFNLVIIWIHQYLAVGLVITTSITNLPSQTSLQVTKLHFTN